MSYKFILALDPSGNFHEGKGTTGWCVFDAKSDRINFAGSISACGYKHMEDYWNAVIDLVLRYNKRYKGSMIVVIEDYMLYESKAKDQINSRMETPKLIGVLQYTLYSKGIPYDMQTASLVKKRWENSILHHKGYIKEKKKKFIVPSTDTPIDRHAIDSIRHAVHYATFKNKEE